MTKRLMRQDWWSLCLVAIGAVLLHVLQWALLPFALAAIVGFLCHPLIEAVRRRTRAPRWTAAVLVFVVVFAGLALLSAAVGVGAAAQVSRLAAVGLSPIHHELERLLGPAGSPAFGGRITADDVTSAIEGLVRRALSPSGLQRFLPGLLAAAAGAVVFVFAAFYAMVSGPSLVSGGLKLAPLSRQPALAADLKTGGEVLRRYFTGVLLVVVFTSLAAFVGYGLMMHVQGALVLCIALGILETIPVVGPIVSALLVALAAFGLHSLAALVLMVGYAAILRLVIDDVVAPIVLGRTTLVHPFLVMIAYVVGASLFGVIGLLFAVPAMALTRMWLRRRSDETDRAEAPLAA
jgi:predicted PurR-regulated permease PerM